MHRFLLSLLFLPLVVLSTAAAEPTPPWLKVPTTVSVNCGRPPFLLAFADANATPIEPVPIGGGPVGTSDPGCICPNPGPGWTKTGDDCKFYPRTRLCDGSCHWESSYFAQSTSTPCGSP